MMIQVECQTQSQLHQSDPSKERWVQLWPVLKEAQAETKAGPIWTQVVAQARRKSKKRCHPTDDLAEVVKTISKDLQEKSTIFPEKVRKG